MDIKGKILNDKIFTKMNSSVSVFEGQQCHLEDKKIHHRDIYHELLFCFKFLYSLNIKKRTAAIFKN